MKVIKVLGVGLMAAVLATGCKKDDKKSDKKPEPAGKTTAKEPPKAPKEPPKEWTSADTQKRFTQCWAAFNNRDEAKFKDCYGDAGELIITDSVPPMSGKGGEGALGIAKQFWTASKDMKATPMLTLINGANYASCYHVTGTNDGPMMGMEPTNKKFSYFAAQMGSFKPDGKLDKDWHISDQATLMHQLGVAPSKVAPDSETPLPETTVVAKNDDAEKANVELVKKGYGLIKEGKYKELEPLMADDVTFRWVPASEMNKGKEAYMKNFDQWTKMHESMSMDLKSMWGAGDWVVAMVEGSGKLAADMPGTKGTKGKEYKTHDIELFQIVDGKVKQQWIFSNSLSMMVQIGAVDPAKMMPAPKK